MVNKKIKKFAVILLVTGTIGLGEISCSVYQNFPMEVLEPSSISIDTDKRLALYDRNVRNADGDLRIEEKNSEYQLLREFANGLNNRIADLKKDTVILLNNHKPTLLKNGDSPQRLSFNILDSL